MAKRAVTTTKEYLKAAALPTYEGDTYTVIPHEFVINETLKNLGAKGFNIKHELYRCNQNANIAQGIYHLDYSNDPDMGMMFAWSNSYDKSMRFKCAIGGYVFVCSNGMVRGDMGSWGRKHTGAADEETIETIQEQISKADRYYKQLVSDKEAMKDIMISETIRAQLIGRLYFEEDLLNSEQLSIIKQQIHTPKHDYNADKKSLWTLYNHITYSLREAHPKNWLDHQKLVHWFFTQEYGIPLVDFLEAEPNEVTEVQQETIVITESTQLSPGEDAIQAVFITEESVMPQVKQSGEQLDLLDAIKEAENSENNLNHL